MSYNKRSHPASFPFLSRSHFQANRQAATNVCSLSPSLVTHTHSRNALNGGTQSRAHTHNHLYTHTETHTHTLAHPARGAPPKCLLPRGGVNNHNDLLSQATNKIKCNKKIWICWYFKENNKAITYKYSKEIEQLSFICNLNHSIILLGSKVMIYRRRHCATLPSDPLSGATAIIFCPPFSSSFSHSTHRTAHLSWDAASLLLRCSA